MLTQIIVDSEDNLSRKVWNFYSTDQLGGSGSILFVLDSYRFETRDDLEAEFKLRFGNPHWNRIDKRENTIAKPRVPQDVVDCAREDIQSRIVFEDEL